ncbi:pentapeptide repeat-containing protein [Saccharicrinis sp. FJH54]|uniref:pentapeptide repeat-containing protein n=1 Tax=Saccharicrinis sp. FJH54 TaxID=3344665 RepID=UPI0035D4DEC8
MMLNAKHIGNKIAKARKKKNMSQAQLAQQLFISSQAVGKWERGESMPDIITINRLAEILNLELNYFSENDRSESLEAATEIPAGTLSGDKVFRDQTDKISWDMSRGNWVDADFSGLKNLHDKFSSSNMKNCLFVGSDLSGILLKGNHVVLCDFSGSEIHGSRIKGSHMVDNKFVNSSLKQTEFSGDHIGRCDFSGADFTGATLSGCDFAKNTLISTVLKRTSFIASQLADITFEGTLEDCVFDNCSFKKVSFQNAVLINSFFKGRKLKGIQFKDCRADRMTFEFLKSGKADLSGITLINE